MIRVTGQAGRFAIVWLVVGLFAAVGAQCAAAGYRADPSLPVLLAQARPAAPPTQSVEANIANLHQRLQITPAQEAQRYRVNAIGAGLNYALPARRVTLSFKYFDEFSNRWTYQGYSLQISAGVGF